MFDRTYKDRKKDEGIETDQFFPRVAGALCTLTQLRQQIDYPIECAKLLDHPLVNVRLARETQPKYNELQVMRLLDSTERNLLK
jgi:hypothetical protein